MTMYCFYQTEDKGKWHLALASERNNLVKSKGAKLISALDVDNDFSTQLTADETLSLKQHGDMFFDFDDDLEFALSSSRSFLCCCKARVWISISVDYTPQAAEVFTPSCPCRCTW